MTAIGTRIRVLRGEAGLTQQELAEQAGLAKGVIERIELGTVARPLAATICRLARVLKVDAESLMDLDAPAKEPGQ